MKNVRIVPSIVSDLVGPGSCIGGILSDFKNYFTEIMKTTFEAGKGALVCGIRSASVFWLVIGCYLDESIPP